MKFQEIVHESSALTQVFCPSLLLAFSSLLCFAILRVLITERNASQAPSPSAAPSRCGVGGKRRAPRRDHKSYLNETEI
jgi:hypothetical protein